jgi:hypothetical protein
LLTADGERRPLVKEYRQPVNFENNPQPISSKEIETAALQSQGIEFCQQCERSQK